MKKHLFFILVALFFFLIQLFALPSVSPPLYAQKTCPYLQYCDAGSGPTSGQQECTGVENPKKGQCEWDKTGQVEPNCQECKPINQPQDTPTPTPTLTPTPTPRQISPHEQAMEHLNQGLLPTEAILTEPSTTSESFLTSIIQTFQKLFHSPLKFFAHSESIHQAYLPKELKPEYQEAKNQSQNKQIQGIAITSPLEALKGLLGGSTGFYGVDLPKEVQEEDIQPEDIQPEENIIQLIQPSEKAFEKAYFPEGINPVTGQR